MIRTLIKSQRGFTLIESLIALFIVGLIAVAFISGLTTGARGTAVANEEATAESIARSQLEYVRACSYNTTYPIDPLLESSLPAGWNIFVDTSQIYMSSSDNTVQMATVNVTHENRLILSLATYKVERP